MTYFFTACFTYFFLRWEKLSSRVVWTGLKRGGEGRGEAVVRALATRLQQQQ